MRFALRCLALAALSLALLACQHNPPAAPVPVDPLAESFQALDQRLAQGQLDDAQTQLRDLQQRAPGDSRLDTYRRQLAEAYLRQGESLLQRGERKAAARAFSQARLWLPAPAASQVERPARRPAAAAKPEPEPEPEPATVVARLIDPHKASNAIAMPMLDASDNKRLRSLLDGVAADVVRFHCAVHIEVRQAKDVPWVSALLSARVKKLQPGFILALSSKVDPNKPPRLLLSPAL